VPSSADDDYGVPIPGEILPPEQWARTAIKRLPPPGPLDWRAVFGREAPLVLDLGCGNGRFILGSALARPEIDHVGIEILPVVIRYATRRANQRGLANVRLAVIGAYEFLAQYIAPASVAEIHLYHPQPFKADRTHGRAHRGMPGGDDHRRLIVPEFLAVVHRSLVAGGLVVLQTDNPAYWNYMQRVAPLLFDFEALSGRWPDAPQGRTRREIYARRRGLKVFRGQGRPKSLTLEAIEEIVRSAPRPKFEA
jgi:tRNA (guanine-N7-)-methyltransferase